MSVEHLELDDVRWRRCQVDATEMTGVDDVRATIADQFRSIAGEPGRHLAAVRVVINGASSAHEALWKDPHGFEAEIRSIAVQTGRLWVEKVKVRTSRPLDLAKAREDDVIGILAQRIADLQGDPEILAVYDAMFADIRKKIGADVRTGDDAPVDPSRIGTAEHLAECLDASLEMVVALLAEERA